MKVGPLRFCRRPTFPLHIGDRGGRRSVGRRLRRIDDAAREAHENRQPDRQQ
jgi:hypothetical protein